jgi:hypothetical protein
MQPTFRGLILTSMLSACLAQTALPPFEVTTIRPNRSGDPQGGVFFQPGRIGSRCSFASFAPLREMSYI